MDLRTSRLRLDAFSKATAALAIPPERITIIPGEFAHRWRRVALEQIMAMPERPTAVFAANDLMAMGLIRAALANGLQVPADLSVIGLDGIRLIADMEPPLTTVALPRFEIRRLAMEMLFELLAADDRAKSTTPTLWRRQVETHLVLRQSTAPPTDGHFI